MVFRNEFGGRTGTLDNADDGHSYHAHMIVLGPRAIWLDLRGAL